MLAAEPAQKVDGLVPQAAIDPVIVAQPRNVCGHPLQQDRIVARRKIDIAQRLLDVFQQLLRLCGRQNRQMDLDERAMLPRRHLHNWVEQGLHSEAERGTAS